MKKCAALFALGLSLTGCSTSATIDSGAPAFELLVTDNAQLKRFDLVLISRDKRPLCLPLSEWPSAVGWLDMGSKRAKIRSESVEYLAADRTFGYSAGEGYRLSKEPLVGFIPYSEFGDPEFISKLPSRQLIFSAYPFPCN